MRTTLEVNSPLSRARAFAPLLSAGQYFSHTTAAMLWGVPLPASAASVELHVSSPGRTAPVRRPGVVGHRSPISALPAIRRFGVPISSAADTWCSLGSLLALADLVAAGDHLILDPMVLDPLDLRPYCTEKELLQAVLGFRGRGRVALRAALSLLRQGAESRPESLVRVAIIQAGLPEPVLGLEVRSASGRFIGRADMAYPDWKVTVEYDGDQHRTSVRQYDTDLIRIDAFIESGRRVVRVRSSGLGSGMPRTVARVDSALRSRGWPPST
jgi:hypothetical protein